MKHSLNMMGIEKHKEFFCGWGAGCVETMILFPQSKLIFRQQLHGVVFRVAFDQVCFWIDIIISFNERFA